MTSHRILKAKLVSALQTAAATGPAEAPDDDVIAFLEELDGFVHQIDNAVDLHSMGGLETVVQFIRDSSRSVAVRAQAAVVVGASASNNPQATENALKVGALHALVVDLWPAAESHPGNALKRVLFATAALLRQSSEGFQQFAKLDGYVESAPRSTPLDVLLGTDGSHPRGMEPFPLFLNTPPPTKQPLLVGGGWG